MCNEWVAWVRLWCWSEWAGCILTLSTMVVSWSSGPVDISPYITILLKESRFTGSPHLHHKIGTYLITHSHYAICILPLLSYISLSEVCILDPTCEYIRRQFQGLYIKLKLIFLVLSTAVVALHRYSLCYYVHLSDANCEFWAFALTFTL